MAHHSKERIWKIFTSSWKHFLAIVTVCYSFYEQYTVADDNHELENKVLNYVDR